MPSYRGDPDYTHDSTEALGVLLVNLGTPAGLTRPDVRAYLQEFLWDPRVIERPRWLWWLVLHGVILRIRPRKTLHAYAQVWTDEGSPLLVIARRQASALEAVLRERVAGPVHLALAMRYGSPSIAEGLESLRARRVRRLLVLPLYPQYSATTTASTFDAVAAVFQTWRWLPELRLVNHYHDDAGYIRCLADSVREHWTREGRPERLLMSFHGLPRAYLLAGDPYHCECQKTGRLLAEALGLEAGEWALSFQSRVGPEEWLKPYTDHTLREWGKAGVRHVQVVCPGFPTDCLETLEEMAMQNRATFLEAGGERYDYIPALNDRPDHIQALAGLVLRHAQGWPEAASDYDPAARAAARVASRERALALGAER